MTVSIALMVEGATEAVLLPPLRRFLQPRLPNIMPRLRVYPSDGRLPKADILKREVQRHLAKHDHVIALTDVYTGNDPREFRTATEAKDRMRAWVGDDARFHPHAAQHEFEAWLIPYWPQIQQLAGSPRSQPTQPPEEINHDRPPSRLLNDVFRSGRKKADFQKILHASAILRDQDLGVAARTCPNLRAFLTTILTVAGGEPL